MDLFRKILYPIESIFYGTIALFAALTLGGVVSFWDELQASTILFASLTGAVAISLLPLAQRLFKVRFSHLVDILIAVDLFFSVYLGEALTFYYLFPNIDKVHPFFATAQLSLAGYLLAKHFLKKNKSERSTVLALVFAFFFAVALESMWEIYEFGYDMIAGTNMQKYIPEEFYQAILGKTIQLDDATIAEFFRTFDGYHFALMDTMLDIVTDVAGGGFGVLFCALLFRYRPELSDHILYKPGSEADALVEEKRNS